MYIISVRSTVPLSINIMHDSLAVLFTLSPFSFISLPILPYIHTLTVHTTLGPIAFVPPPRFESHYSRTIPKAVFKMPFIIRALCLQFALPFHLVFKPVSFVHVAVTPDLCTFAFSLMNEEPMPMPMPMPIKNK